MVHLQLQFLEDFLCHVCPPRSFLITGQLIRKRLATTKKEDFLSKMMTRKNHLDNVVLEILWHVRFGDVRQIVVGHGLPAVDAVQLEQEARLAVVVPVVFFTDALDVAALENKTRVGKFYRYEAWDEVLYAEQISFSRKVIKN
jgi:hypothetical protein